MLTRDLPSRRTAAVPKRLANLQHLPQRDAPKGAGGRFGEDFYQSLARASSQSCENDGKRPWEERLVEAEPQLVRCYFCAARFHLGPGKPHKRDEATTCVPQEFLLRLRLSLRDGNGHRTPVRRRLASPRPILAVPSHCVRDGRMARARFNRAVCRFCNCLQRQGAAI